MGYLSLKEKKGQIQGRPLDPNRQAYQEQDRGPGEQETAEIHNRVYIS
jgi:hypothetical protein